MIETSPTIVGSAPVAYAWRRHAKSSKPISILKKTNDANSITTNYHHNCSSNTNGNNTNSLYNDVIDEYKIFDGSPMTKASATPCKANTNETFCCMDDLLFYYFDDYYCNSNNNVSDSNNNLSTRRRERINEHRAQVSQPANKRPSIFMLCFFVHVHISFSYLTRSSFSIVACFRMLSCCCCCIACYFIFSYIDFI